MAHASTMASSGDEEGAAQSVEAGETGETGAEGEAKAEQEAKAAVVEKEAALFDLGGLFGVQRVNHGDPREDFVWPWPVAGAREPITLHLADGDIHLMAQHVWQSALTLAEEVVAQRVDVQGKVVLELGAGAALPGIVSRKCGAKFVCISDYPEDKIVANMRRNVAENEVVALDGPAAVVGYKWGDAVDELALASPTGFYDVVIMADTLWMENQHANLISTIHALAAAHPRSSELRVVLTYMNHDDGRGTAKRFFQRATADGRLVQREGRNIAWREENGCPDDESDSDDPDHYGPVHFAILALPELPLLPEAPLLPEKPPVDACT